jgi:cell division protein FtsB
VPRWLAFVRVRGENHFLCVVVIKYLLLAVVVAGLIYGYYDCDQLLQRNSDFDWKLGKQGSRIDALEAQQKELVADNARLTQAQRDESAQISDLTKQLKLVQDALNSSTKKPVVETPPPPVVKPKPILRTYLSNMKLGDKSYANCRLLKVEAKVIVVGYNGMSGDFSASGVVEFPYADLPPELQKEFGYDPVSGADLTDEQVEALEEERKEGATSGL